MKILNVGPLELILLFILMFIILGPDDMVNIARKLGRMVYRITHSEIFRSIVRMAQEIRQIPAKFIEETGLDETVAQLKDDAAEISKEMKEIGVEEAISEVNATTTEVAQEVNKAAAQAIETPKPTSIHQSPEVNKEIPVQAVSDIPKEPQKTSSSLSFQVQYPEPVKSVPIPSLSLVANESSFDNDFKFSQDIFVQTITARYIANSLEPSESLLSVDD